MTITKSCPYTNCKASLVVVPSDEVLKKPHNERNSIIKQLSMRLRTELKNQHKDGSHHNGR